jgi:phosphate transport system substrate-binding protein
MNTMKMRTFTLVVTLGLAALLVFAMAAAGCTDSTKNPAAATPVPTTAAAVGTTQVPGASPAITAQAAVGQKQSIKVSGSTTMLPIAQKAAEAYMASYPDADIRISGGGSGVGIQQIGEKTVDIGMSSRDLKDIEIQKYPSLVKNVVAKDGIAIIVNPANEIRVIQVSNVSDIYTGKIARWTEVSGASVPNTNNQIVVIGRDSASGTREFFDTHANGVLKGAPPTKSMLEKNSNGAVAQTIAQTPGAIGYVSIGFVTNDVRALPIWSNDPKNAVAPIKENILSGKYPLSRELFMLTNGQPTGLAKDFIDFIRSPNGQKIVEAEGYVTIS